MVKVLGTTGVTNSKISELEKQAAAQTPVEEQPAPSPAPEQAPKTTSVQEFLQRAGAEPQSGPESDGTLESGVDQAVDELAISPEEVSAGEVMNMKDRARSQEYDAWNFRNPVQKEVANSAKPDGGLRSRANGLAQSLSQGIMFPSMAIKSAEVTAAKREGKDPGEVADAMAAAKTGAFAAALTRVGAIEKQTLPNGKEFEAVSPLYAQVGSAVVEDFLFDASQGEADVSIQDFQTEAERAADITPEGEFDAAPGKKPVKQQPIARGHRNAALGNKIHIEAQRMMGNTNPDKLPNEEATTVGDMFKVLWQKQNPNLAKIDKRPGDNQDYMWLTERGINELTAGSEARKQLFKKPNVRPAKQVPTGGKLHGDIGKNVVKSVSGQIGKKSKGRIQEESMKNLSTVANMVIPEREKLLYQAALTALRDGDAALDSVEAHILGIGREKLQSMEAKIGDPVQAREAFEQLRDTVAQTILATAQEAGSANYLTYYLQAYNGRIAPQQAYFDPTSYKTVRFATGSKPKVVKKGSRREKNLKQMYATMLIGDVTPDYKPYTKADKAAGVTKLKADALLADKRELALKAAGPKLYAWGRKLRALRDQTMPNEMLNGVRDAVRNKLPISDPTFQGVNGFGLDPQADADLLAAIKGKGEDGLAYMDGLIDYANYRDAVDTGRDHTTRFNAYIDGKTNGLAANGMQLGNTNHAIKTGVLRNNNIQLLDDGDLRDDVERIALDSLNEAWEFNTDGWTAELNDAATALFGERDFNKKTTMTYGYGKEIESFNQTAEEFLNDIKAKSADNPQLVYAIDKAFEMAKKTNPQSRHPLGDIIMSKYGPSVMSVMSEDAQHARQLMRSANGAFAMMDELFTIQGPIRGQELYFGNTESTGYEGADVVRHRIYDQEGKSSDVYTPHYKTKATSAAKRKKTLDSGEIVETPGGYGHGGSIPGPVQALDAATVTSMTTGKSWDKLKAASGGDPYIHTIYDAFKTDVDGHDVIVKEVNDNWVKLTTQWSYLNETRDSLKETMQNWKDKMRERIRAEGGDSPAPTNETVYAAWLFEGGTTSTGKPYLKNFLKQSQSFKTMEFNDAWQKQQNVAKKLKDMGYDPYNPTPITNSQLLEMMSIYEQEFNTVSRLSSLGAKTDKQRADLVKEIRESGNPVLQYYAH